MSRGVGAVLAIGLVAPLAAAQQTKTRATSEAARPAEEKADGYAEWRVGSCLLADGQRVCPAPKARFKGEGEAKDFASVPLGYELKAKGARVADGSLLATEIEAKPNGSALFESEVKSATDTAELKYRQAGSFFQEAGNGRITSI